MLRRSLFWSVPALLLGFFNTPSEAKSLIAIATPLKLRSIPEAKVRLIYSNEAKAIHGYEVTIDNEEELDEESCMVRNATIYCNGEEFKMLSNRYRITEINFEVRD